MLIPPIEVLLNHDQEGNLKPGRREKFLKKGVSEETLTRWEQEAREIIQECNENRTKLKERGIARSDLTVGEQLSEGYITLEDLV